MKKIKIESSQIKTRVTWGFNPVTRVIKNKPTYSRKKFNKRNLLKEI